MKICSQTDLREIFRLNVKSQLPPTWPQVAWQGLGLHTNSSSPFFLDLTHLALGEVFKGLCPQPGYQDLKALRLVTKQIENRLGQPLWSDVQLGMGLPQEAYVQTLLDWLMGAPDEFLVWCDRRGLKWGHLRPLTLVSPKEPWLQALAAINPTLQQGQQLIELAVELRLMKVGEVGPEPEEDATSWEARLRALRYPVSQAQLQKKQDQVAQTPWPPGFQGRWVRRGDQQALELKLAATSPQELRKLSARLKVLAEGKGAELWS